MNKFGLKLWSTNIEYQEEAIRLFEKGYYDYIELYVVPESYNTTINNWIDIKIPFVIHAPHWREGLNLAKADCKEMNIKLIEETQKFADKLNTDKIIIHPGIAGDINETIKQLKLINDKRILIENKPYYALDDDLICNGNSPEEIKLVIEETKVRFCLDIGHAICSANAHNKRYMEYIKDFLDLRPLMFHISDGSSDSLYDMHYHIGKGNFDFKNILSILPDNALMTIETIKDSIDDLKDFINDVDILKNYIGLKNNYEKKLP